MDTRCWKIEPGEPSNLWGVPVAFSVDEWAGYWGQSKPTIWVNHDLLILRDVLGVRE